MYRKCILNIEPYRPGKPIKEVERELGLKNCYKLASNENLLGPSKKALVSIKNSFKEINYYPDGSGYYLRNEISRRLEIPPDQILLGNGSDELLQIIGLTFINPLDEVIVSREGFVRYQMVVDIMDGKNVFVNMKDHYYDLQAIIKSITNKTKLIFIANPNNPTGTAIYANEMNEFIDKIPDNIVVVLDEAYYEFTDKKKFPDSLSYIRQNKKVIVLRTFSKVYGLAGLRLGYALSLPEIVKNMNKVRCPFNVNSIAEIAAISALNDREHLKKTQNIIKEEKKFLYTELDKIGVKYLRSETNFILMYLGNTALSIYESMLRSGIIIRPMEMYNLSEWLRVTIGTHYMNQKFIKKLKKLL
ncbi:MAG: histidinol-phosphate transaminase [Candidatus Firestonebacteria bacterium]|nr:histidinol-phosphate transaminase [Candidatus Firestonebacteria bacterium]